MNKQNTNPEHQNFGSLIQSCVLRWKEARLILIGSSERVRYILREKVKLVLYTRSTMAHECFSCTKVIMMAINTIIFLFGLVLLAMAIWVRLDQRFADFNTNDISFLYKACYIVIALGFCIAVVGFLGCMGACQESVCMLWTFMFFLGVLFVALMGVGIWIFMDEDRLKEVITTTLKEAMSEYKKSSAIRTFMDTIQVEFKCCGASLASLDYIKRLTTIPKSCTSQGLIHAAVPCNIAVYTKMKSYASALGAVALGIGGLVILSMLMAGCLARCVMTRSSMTI